MKQPQDRVLVVEEDPEISDLISRQTLKPLGYHVMVINDAPMAIQEAVKFDPHVMIVSLDLPGLSGKDLLVAFSSQGLEMPVIVIANEGMEGDVIQAFRLGASDYLRRPIREAEVVAAVERAMTQVRARRDRNQLARKVERTNTELQSRVRELTTILGIGKAVTSITDRHALFDKIIEGAVFVAEADKGWLLLREGDSKTFRLSAQRNLPKSVAEKMNAPWDDGVSSLVALSGEPLSIHGPPIRRLKVARYGRSVLVVPVKIKKEIVGLLVVVRDEPKPFTNSNRTLLEALADYASISLVNVKLFQAVEDRARSLMLIAESARDSEKLKAEILHHLHIELQNVLTTINHHLRIMVEDRSNPLDEQQMGYVRLIQEQLHQADVISTGLNLLNQVHTPKKKLTLSLTDLARSAISRRQDEAQKEAVSLELIKPAKTLFVSTDKTKINQVFDALLSSAIRVSKDGEVIIQISSDQGGMAHVSIRDSGPGISDKDLPKVFEPFYRRDTQSRDHFRTLGIELALAREIVRTHNGKIWVENSKERGSTFHFTLPAAG